MNDEERRGGPLPWGSVFDIDANARALGDVQARALSAAGALVDRLVAAVDGARAAAARSAPPTEGDLDGAEPDPRPADALVDLWADLLHKGIDALGRLAPADADDPLRVDLSGSGAVTVVCWDASAGTVTDRELWLHNPGSSALGQVALRIDGLHRPDGVPLPPGAIGCEPALLEVPERSSRAVTVRLSPPEGTTPGRYRGVIQADGAPHVWLPVELVVA